MSIELKYLISGNVFPAMEAYFYSPRMKLLNK